MTNQCPRQTPRGRLVPQVVFACAANGGRSVISRAPRPSTTPPAASLAISAGTEPGEQSTPRWPRRSRASASTPRGRRPSCSPRRRSPPATSPSPWAAARTAPTCPASSTSTGPSTTPGSGRRHRPRDHRRHRHPGPRPARRARARHRAAALGAGPAAQHLIGCLGPRRRRTHAQQVHPVIDQPDPAGREGRRPPHHHTPRGRGGPQEEVVLDGRHPRPDLSRRRLPPAADDVEHPDVVDDVVDDLVEQVLSRGAWIVLVRPGTIPDNQRIALTTRQR